MMWEVVARLQKTWQSEMQHAKAMAGGGVAPGDVTLRGVIGGGMAPRDVVGAA